MTACLAQPVPSSAHLPIHLGSQTATLVLAARLLLTECCVPCVPGRADCCVAGRLPDADCCVAGRPADCCVPGRPDCCVAGREASVSVGWETGRDLVQSPLRTEHFGHRYERSDRML